MGLLDRLRSTGKSLEVEAVDDTRAFEGSKGDRLFSRGAVPVDSDGAPLRDAEHSTSNPQVLHARVAGTHHNPTALSDSRFDPGSRVTLRQGPGTPSDPNAVGVWDSAGLVQAGYLPATLSRAVARMLRSGTALEGQVVRELRLHSERGERIAVYVLIAPPGRIEFVGRERPTA
ncbi:MAG TPA: HIRAN domain-containing protein [Solirubrobacteraceae bacterium]|nr:HIRAN domain-containing protein [Solirubrobacteraceae bacterium]